MADVQETRNALWRREEQLRRWNLSDTNSESGFPKPRDRTKVKFQDGCVFLAACASGDTEEVENLLARGADINTTNIDGLTALHQACIDDDIDMVEFLLVRKADIDACDNEGWTALHATASCGFLDIAKYLIDKEANIAAVNNDGDLAIDLAEGDDMENLIYEEMVRLGIDADSARTEEEQVMLRDSNQWLDGKFEESPHPRTGATALHVAAAKGYIKVMKNLIDAGAKIDAKDFDGWTPFHAAAHWGQEESCKVLVENFCNMDVKNNSGQTAFDISDPDLDPLLDELKTKQATLMKDISFDTSRRNLNQNKRRSSVTRMSVDQKQNMVLKNVEEERAQLEANKNKFVEDIPGRKIEEVSPAEGPVVGSGDESSGEENKNAETAKKNAINTDKTSQALQPSSKPQVNGTLPERTKPAQETMPKIEETKEMKPPPPKSSLPQSQAPPAAPTPRIQDVPKSSQLSKDANKENNVISSSAELSKKQLTENTPMVKETKKEDKESSKEGKQDNKVGDSEVPSFAPKPLDMGDGHDNKGPSSWRAGLRKTGSSSAVPEGSINKRDHEKITRSASSSWLGPEKQQDDTKRRVVSYAGSGEAPESKTRFNDFYTRYTSLVDSNTSNVTSGQTAPTTTTTATTTTTTTTPGSGLTYQPYVPMLRRQESEDKEKKERDRGSTTNTTTQQQRRSFEPPKRDEEKEVERKARAKRARESRRSTQGVTKEDLERAEITLQQANKKAGNEHDLVSTDDKSDKENKPENSKLSLPNMTVKEKTTEESKSTMSSSLLRKPRDTGILSESSSSSSGYSRSYRTQSPAITSTHSISSTTSSLPQSVTSSAPSTSTSLPTTSTSYRYASYLKNKTEEDREKDKEQAKGESKVDKEEKEDPSQKSSAIRTRRKRESRRPTGKVVPEDLQGIESEEKSGKLGQESKSEEDPKLQGSRHSSGSRYSEPAGSIYDSSSSGLTSNRSERPSSYTGSSYSRTYSSTSLPEKELDYKKLYNEQKLETEKFRKETKKLQTELSDCKFDLEKARIKNDSANRTLSDSSGNISADRRERRALERKISELEEELKAMENLKADNQRLKEENGALIRVISKLSK